MDKWYKTGESWNIILYVSNSLDKLRGLEQTQNQRELEHYVVQTKKEDIEKQNKIYKSL